MKIFTRLFFSLLLSFGFTGIALADGSFNALLTQSNYSDSPGHVITIPVELSNFYFVHKTTPNGMPASAEIDEIRGDSGFTITQNSCGTIYPDSSACNFELSYTIPSGASEGIYHYQIHLLGHDRGTTSVANFKSNTLDIYIKVISSVTPVDESITLRREDSQGATITVGTTAEFQYEVSTKLGNTLSPVTITIPALPGLNVKEGSNCIEPMGRNACEFSVLYTPSMTDLGDHDIAVKVNAGDGVVAEENLYVKVMDKLPDNSAILVEPDDNEVITLFAGEAPKDIPYTVTNTGSTELKGLHLSIVDSLTRPIKGNVNILANSCEGQTLTPAPAVGNSCKFLVEYTAPSELNENSTDDTFDIAALATHDGKDAYNSSSRTVTVDHKVTNDLLVVSVNAPQTPVELGADAQIIFTLHNASKDPIKDLIELKSETVKVDGQDLALATLLVNLVDNNCATTLSTTDCTITLKYKANDINQSGTHRITLETLGTQWGKDIDNTTTAQVNTPSPEGNVAVSVSPPSLIYSGYPGTILFSLTNTTSASIKLATLSETVDDTALTLSPVDDACQVGETLGKGDSCHLEATYDPAKTTELVNHTAKFDVTADQFTKTLTGNDIASFQSKEAAGLIISEDTSHAGYIGHTSDREGDYYYTVKNIEIPKVTIHSINISNDFGSEYNNVSADLGNCINKNNGVLNPGDSCTIQFHYQFVGENGDEDYVHVNIDATNGKGEQVGDSNYTIPFNTARDLIIVKQPTFPQTITEANSFMILNYFFQNKGTADNKIWLDSDSAKMVVPYNTSNAKEPFAASSSEIFACNTDQDANPSGIAFKIKAGQACFIQFVYTHKDNASLKQALTFYYNSQNTVTSIKKMIDITYVAPTTNVEGSWVNSHANQVPEDNLLYKDNKGTDWSGNYITHFMIGDLSGANFTNNKLAFYYTSYAAGYSSSATSAQWRSQLGPDYGSDALNYALNSEDARSFTVTPAWTKNANILDIARTPLGQMDESPYYALATGIVADDPKSPVSYQIKNIQGNLIYDGFTDNTNKFISMLMREQGDKKTLYINEFHSDADNTKNRFQIRVVSFSDSGNNIQGQTNTVYAVPTGCQAIVSMQIAQDKKDATKEDLYIVCTADAFQSAGYYDFGHYAVYKSVIADDGALSFEDKDLLAINGNSPVNLSGINQLSASQLLSFGYYRKIDIVTSPIAQLIYGWMGTSGGNIAQNQNLGSKIYINEVGDIIVFNTRGSQPVTTTVNTYDMKQSPYSTSNNSTYGYGANTELDISADDGASWQRVSLDAISPDTDTSDYLQDVSSLLKNNVTGLSDLTSYNLGFVPVETNASNKNKAIVFFTGSTGFGAGIRGNGGALRISYDEGASWQVYPFVNRQYTSKTDSSAIFGGNYMPYGIDIVDLSTEEYMLLDGRYYNDIETFQRGVPGYIDQYPGDIYKAYAFPGAKTLRLMAFKTS
jgi:hypothetical protein